MKGVSDSVLMALVLAAGAMLPLQALVNGRLSSQLGSPLWAAAVQNVIGSALMIAAILALRPTTPNLGQVAAAPPWVWVGGFLGAYYVLSSMLAAPRLGATSAMVAIIAGQLVASLALDQFGVLQVRRPVDLRAIAGVGLVVAGAVLILGRQRAAA